MFALATFQEMLLAENDVDLGDPSSKSCWYPFVALINLNHVSRHVPVAEVGDLLGRDCIVGLGYVLKTR